MEVLIFFVIVVVTMGLIVLNTALMDKVDVYTMKKFNHEYFSFHSFAYGGFGWFVFVCGGFWYLGEGGLNATVLMAIGGFFILTHFLYKVKKTSLLTALLLLPYQSLVYAIGSFMSIMAVLLLLSFFSKEE